MTSVLDESTDVAFDPHASKISPDDPKLRITRVRTPRLRKGKIAAAISCVALVVVSGLAYATAGGGARVKTKQSAAATVRASVPDAILRGPVAPPQPVVSAKAIASPAEPPPPLPAVPQTPRGESSGGAQDTGPHSPSAIKRKRIEEFWAARSAGILADLGPMPNDVGSPEVDDGRPAGRDAPSELSPSGFEAPSGVAGDLASGADPNMQTRKTDFLMAAGRGRGDGYLHARLQKPRSPYEVKAGTVIPAVLTTGINSDLPGPVFARVREDVYDSVRHTYLLIPQNSTLVASYDSMVAWGQERVLLCWQRLILPNGSSISLECMTGADLAGAAGLTDRVDEHWLRIVQGAAVGSLLSAATTAAAGNTAGFNPTVPQMWARGAANEIGNAGENITRRNIMVQPTITVRPGWALNVMVTKDMILEPYDATTR